MELSTLMRRYIPWLFIISLVIIPVLAHEAGFPSETLKKVFPDARRFTARKKAITPEQVQNIEKRPAAR